MRSRTSRGDRRISYKRRRSRTHRSPRCRSRTRRRGGRFRSGDRLNACDASEEENPCPVCFEDISTEPSVQWSCRYHYTHKKCAFMMIQHTYNLEQIENIHNQFFTPTLPSPHVHGEGGRVQENRNAILLCPICRAATIITNLFTLFEFLCYKIDLLPPNVQWVNIWTPERFVDIPEQLEIIVNAIILKPQVNKVDDHPFYRDYHKSMMIGSIGKGSSESLLRFMDALIIHYCLQTRPLRSFDNRSKGSSFELHDHPQLDMSLVQQVLDRHQEGIKRMHVEKLTNRLSFPSNLLSLQVFLSDLEAIDLSRVKQLKSLVIGNMRCTSSFINSLSTQVVLRALTLYKIDHADNNCLDALVQLARNGEMQLLILFESSSLFETTRRLYNFLNELNGIVRKVVVWDTKFYCHLNNMSQTWPHEWNIYSSRNEPDYEDLIQEFIRNRELRPRQLLS